MESCIKSGSKLRSVRPKRKLCMNSAQDQSMDQRDRRGEPPAVPPPWILLISRRDVGDAWSKRSSGECDGHAHTFCSIIAYRHTESSKAFTADLIATLLGTLNGKQVRWRLRPSKGIPAGTSVQGRATLGRPASGGAFQVAGKLVFSEAKLPKPFFDSHNKSLSTRYRPENHGEYASLVLEQRKGKSGAAGESVGCASCTCLPGRRSAAYSTDFFYCSSRPRSNEQGARGARALQITNRG